MMSRTIHVLTAPPQVPTYLMGYNNTMASVHASLDQMQVFSHASVRDVCLLLMRVSLLICVCC